MIKKRAVIWFLSALVLGLLVAHPPVPAYAADPGTLPNVRLAYIFTSHHTPLIVALARGEAFEDSGIYLKTVIPREKYLLVAEGKPMAHVDIIVNKSGSETATFFAMNRLDLGLASVTAIMAGIDQGTAIKVLSPMQSDGMALVFPKQSTVDSWDAFLEHVRGSRQPVSIGYHSPTSGPKILLEGALKEAGIRVTSNPNDHRAQVVLVDLKSTSNLGPALISGQVDGWVGPSPFPEVAVTAGTGRIVLDLRDLPPHGRWEDFPCCVIAGRDAFIREHPQVARAVLDLIHHATHWVKENREEADALTSRWIGIPLEAARLSQMTFSGTPSANWLRGTGIYLDILNQMNQFSGSLKGMSQDEVKPLLFDFALSEGK